MSEGSDPAGTTTVTVLFTDLVGSTALFSRLSREAAASLRREHIEDLRKAVSDHGGEMGKDLGDGIMAVFGGAKAGLDAAVAMQQAVDRHNRTGGEALGLRVGLSTGEAYREGGDHHGDVVVEAARICALADGGQILATDAVHFIARRTEHRFTVVGEQDLKGLPEPVLVVEVAWDPAREAAPVPVPPRLAGLHGTGFVGRTTEWTALNDCLSQTWAGDRQVVLIGGEPGVGKTRLCSALAATASDLGAAVLYGRCDEEVGRPYQPWVEALQYLVANCPPSLLAGYLDEHHAELHRLLPDVTPEDAAPPSTSGDPEAERYRLWSAVARLLAHVSTETVVVLILDDLQWADRETLQLLRHLFSLDAQMRVLVLATYRDTEVDPDHPLADLVVWLRREPRATILPLVGLGEADIVDLMEQRAGHKLEADGKALATALWEETGGNPFFAGEMLRHLSETDAIARRPDGHWVTQRSLDLQALPASVREVVGHRIRRLGAEAEQILGVASVVGQYFDLDLVAAAAGAHEDQVLEVLERASAATLVAEVPGTAGRFAFQHALIQHTVYGGLSATRRQRLHRRVAETLEDLCGDNFGERVVELARHWGATAVPTDASKAIHYASLAGDIALSSLGPDEAVRCYTRALDVLDGVGEVDERVRCQLKVSLGLAQRQSGDSAFRQTLLDAGQQAAELGETDLVVRAALGVNRGFYSSTTGDSDRIQLIETALGVVQPDSPDRARLLATLASELTFDPDEARRKALASEAVALARRCADPVALIDAICLPRLAMHLPDTLDERLALTAEAVGLARTLGDPSARFHAYVTRRYPLLMSGEIDEADQCLAESESLAAEISQPALLWSLTLSLGVRALHAGDAAEAERRAEEAFKLGTDSGQPDAAGVHAAQMIFIRWYQGRLGEVVPILEQLNAIAPHPILNAGLAVAYSETGDLAAARPLLAEVKRTAVGASFDYIFLMVMSHWAVSAAEVGDVDVAAILYDQLLPWESRVGFTGVAMTGAAAHYLGRLATVLGQHDRANAHFAKALGIHERLRAPFFIASTQLEWGRLLQSTEPERARGMLTRARDLAAAHGCSRVERLAGEALSGTGPQR